MHNKLIIENYLQAYERLQAKTTASMLNANNCLGTSSQCYYECHAAGPSGCLPAPFQPSTRFVIMTIIHI